jgi:MerR family transcriptional regulator, light-induced transcriptional regulator
MVNSISLVFDAFLEAQLRGDARGAIRVLANALQQGADVAALRRDVVARAQGAVGEKWANNEISVAHEHMATAIAHAALSHLYWNAPPGERTTKTVVVTCVEGELHGFPARLAADALDLAGFEVKYLGADVPLSGLLEVLRQSPPDLLALSTTLAFHLPKLRATVAAVREEMPGLPIIVGGQAVSDWTTLAAELGTDGGAGSAEELTAIVTKLLGPPPSP